MRMKHAHGHQAKLEEVGVNELLDEKGATFSDLDPVALGGGHQHLDSVVAIIAIGRESNSSILEARRLSEAQASAGTTSSGQILTGRPGFASDEPAPR